MLNRTPVLPNILFSEYTPTRHLGPLPIFNVFKAILTQNTVYKPLIMNCNSVLCFKYDIVLVFEEIVQVKGLTQLDWLPISYRIEYKDAKLDHKTHSTALPT